MRARDTSVLYAASSIQTLRNTEVIATNDPARAFCLLELRRIERYPSVLDVTTGMFMPPPPRKHLFLIDVMLFLYGLAEKALSSRLPKSWKVEKAETIFLEI